MCDVLGFWSTKKMCIPKKHFESQKKFLHPQKSFLHPKKNFVSQKKNCIPKKVFCIPKNPSPQSRPNSHHRGQTRHCTFTQCTHQEISQHVASPTRSCKSHRSQHLHPPASFPARQSTSNTVQFTHQRAPHIIDRHFLIDLYLMVGHTSIVIHTTKACTSLVITSFTSVPAIHRCWVPSHLTLRATNIDPSRICPPKSMTLGILLLLPCKRDPDTLPDTPGHVWTEASLHFFPLWITRNRHIPAVN